MLASTLAWAAAAVAVGVAYRHHRKRSGDAKAAALLALVVLGSGCLFELLSPRPAAGAWVAAACVAGALFLAFDREPFPGGRPAEIYPERRAWPFPFLSILLLLVGLRWSPLCLPFVAPVLAVAPRGRRKAALAFAAAGVAAVAVLQFLRPAWAAEWPTASSVLNRFEPVFAGWNLAYLFAGQNVGLVLWFLPVVLLLACYRPGTRRGWLLAAAIGGTLALPFVWPHNFWGGPDAVTNRAFLPVYGALWFLPARVPRWRWLILAAIAAGVVLWPAWRSPLATARGEARPALDERSLASRLPYETTQRHAPAFAEWQGIGVVSRSLAATLRDGDGGPVFYAADGRAELMIAAERPLEAVLMHFGPRAGTELEVFGGRAGNTVFRPDGGIRFEIVLDGADRRHPLWLDDRRRYVYLFGIAMPGAPERPLPVEILARPAGALPRFLDPSSAGEGR